MPISRPNAHIVLLQSSLMEIILMSSTHDVIKHYSETHAVTSTAVGCINQVLYIICHMITQELLGLNFCLRAVLSFRLPQTVAFTILYLLLSVDDISYLIFVTSIQKPSTP